MTHTSHDTHQSLQLICLSEGTTDSAVTAISADMLENAHQEYQYLKTYLDTMPSFDFSWMAKAKYTRDEALSKMKYYYLHMMNGV